MKWLLILMIFMISCAPAGASRSTPITSKPAFTVDCLKQERRWAYINECISVGVFQKVEKPGSLPHVWVTPIFYEANFDDKEAFAGVVFAYYYCEDNEISAVILYDSKTGKTVGRYSPNLGGLEMD